MTFAYALNKRSGSVRAFALVETQQDVVVAIKDWNESGRLHKNFSKEL
jgi:hypothetical protein